MTDFSFRAARPKTAKEVVNDAMEKIGQQELDSSRMMGNVEPAPKRKRRTRAEIEAAEPGRMLHERPNEMAVLKSCLKQLRQLDPKDALRIVQVMEVMFK